MKMKKIHDQRQNLEVMMCPITMDPIQVAGITACGSIYEYDAIVQWFVDPTHHNDPLTNLILPTTFILRHTYLKSVELRAETVREHTKLWSPQTKLIWARTWEKALVAAKIMQKQLWENPEWTIFEAKFNAEFDTFDSTAYFEGCGAEITAQPGRLDNSGSGMEFIRLKNQNVSNKDFKSESFSGSTITNCTFSDCGFSRVSFIGVHFSNVTFNNCRFIGEQLSFFGSTGTIEFDELVQIEDFSWKRASTWTEVRHILKSRGFKGKLK